MDHCKTHTIFNARCTECHGTRAANREVEVNKIKSKFNELITEAKDLKLPTPFPFNQTREQWRKVLAALAMNGAIDAWARGEVDDWSKDDVAYDCFQLADAMIKQAEEGGE